MITDLYVLKAFCDKHMSLEEGHFIYIDPIKYTNITSNTSRFPYHILNNLYIKELISKKYISEYTEKLNYTTGTEYQKRYILTPLGKEMLNLARL